MKKALLAVALLSIAAGAGASNWVSVLDNSQYTMGVDTETYKTAGSNRDFWTKQDYKATQKTTKGKPYTSVSSKWHINCANDTWSASSITYYDQAGQLVTASDGFGAMDIIPDTLPQIVEKEVCK
jgi:hypothetical protein